jgi:ubiquinone/menaquinone biosynthesis C-methylase UbiE
MTDQRDPKRIVERGYDQIAERDATLAAQEHADERARYVDLVIQRLPAGAVVLEMGGGAGETTTQALAERFSYTGVDLSSRSVDLARKSMPNATFLHAVMTALELEPERLDAMVASFSIIHAPRDEQPGLRAKVARWLRPGGVFVATMGAGSTESGYKDDGLGAPMCWRHFDAATNRRLVAEAGLAGESATLGTADEDGAPVTYVWVVARKPAIQEDAAG